jgi:hypothetical protein
VSHYDVSLLVEMAESPNLLPVNVGYDPRHSSLLVFMNTSLYLRILEKLWVYRGFYENFYKREIIPLKKIEAFSSHIKYSITRFKVFLE